MSKIKLVHSDGNSISIAAPATNPASDLELKLPATIGNAGQALINSSTAGTLEFGTPSAASRNLVINGAMNVAQRATSGVTTSGYGTVDRFKSNHNGTDEAITQKQEALTSSDTGPWEKGFRNQFKLRNGNQTSGAGAGDHSNLQYRIEAQDMASSGWNYTSTSSYITLSFWVRSSVAQNFYGYLKTSDGTEQRYPFETGSLTADTWTKITKTIPGHANLQFDINNEVGLIIVIAPFWGTNYTASGVTLNAWGAYASDTRTPDYTSTWWTTDNALFGITGVQLEVGSYATDFEHRLYGDELQRCKRYYQQIVYASGNEYRLMNASVYDNSNPGAQCYGVIHFPVEMRAAPALAGGLSGTDYWRHKRAYNGGHGSEIFDTIDLKKSSTITAELKGSGSFDGGQNGATGTVYTNNASTSLGLDAEI